MGITSFIGNIHVHHAFVNLFVTTPQLYGIFLRERPAGFGAYGDIPTVTATHSRTFAWRLFVSGAFADSSHDISRGRQLLHSGSSGRNGDLTAINTSNQWRTILRALRRRGSALMAADFLNGKKIFFFRPYIAAARGTRAEIRATSNMRLWKQAISNMKAFASGEKLTVRIILIPSKEEVYAWVAAAPSRGQPRQCLPRWAGSEKGCTTKRA